MAKWIKAKWVITPAAGGVSFQAFASYKEEETTNGDGRLVRHRSAVPLLDTIQVTRSNDTKHKPSGTILDQGEFMVQDISENVEPLKDMLVKGHIRLDDWDLHHKLLDLSTPEPVDIIVTQPKMVEANEPTKSVMNALDENKRKKAEALKKAFEESEKTSKKSSK